MSSDNLARRIYDFWYGTIPLQLVLSANKARHSRQGKGTHLKSVQS